MFQQVAILGPGLLGASLAMALKARGLSGRVVAWSRRAETRAKCRTRPWCDAVEESAQQAVAGSDLVVLCTPVATIAPLVGELAGHVEPGALVTDVGSTKSLICRQARSLLSGRGGAFIGSHPMAGSELAGMEHAREDLFAGAPCFVTPVEDDPDHEVARLIRFWEALDMTVETLSPERHDEVVAHISHLPHFIASSLCGYLASRDPRWAHFAGPGLRDSTRIASGDPGLWRQIFSQNRDELLRALDGFEDELHALKAALLNDESTGVAALLERGKQYRDRLRTE